VTRRLASRFIDRSRWAHAVHGVPVANGRNFGLVRIHGKDAGSSAPGGDLAHSGVPNDINIDPQANGQIAALAPASKAKTGQPGSCTQICPFDLFTTHGEGVPWVANVDAGSSIADIDGESNLRLNIDNRDAPDEGNTAAVFPPGTSLAELDCAGLSWCSPGGSGHLDPPPGAARGAFPDCCDPSGDGFGTIFGPGGPTFPTGYPIFALLPDATPEQIGTGDTPMLRLTINGAVVEQPLTLPYVFATVPTIDTWSDGAGHSGTLTYLGFGEVIPDICPGGPPGNPCDRCRWPPAPLAM
jgi:hypothetical protein